MGIGQTTNWNKIFVTVPKMMSVCIIFGWKHCLIFIYISHTFWSILFLCVYALDEPLTNVMNVDDDCDFSKSIHMVTNSNKVTQDKAKC